MINTSSLLKRLNSFEDKINKQTHANIIINDSRMVIHASQEKIYIPSPTGLIAHMDDAFVRVIMGPYGSGKSTWAVSEIVRRSCGMPVWADGNRRRSRWAIVRNTSGELQSTTLQTWLAWFGELGDITKRQKPILTYEHTFNDGYGLVELELLFIALDREEDVRKIKSLELTGCYINELSEVPQAALAHMKGRVNRYPSHAFCKIPYWSGIIADTNPPDEDHWIYKNFEEKQIESNRLFKQPPGLIKNDGVWITNPHADNVANLSSDYYEKLAEGQSQEFINVFCLGKYGTVGFGKLVFTDFNSDLHAVDNLEAIQGEPLYLGWDFGLCYSDDTEVLTDSGWKLFKDVDEEVDFAATRNPDTGSMEFTHINFKVEYDYDGELLEWSSSNVNFCVTPEHRVPFTYRDTPNKVHFQSAEWLSDHHSGHHYVDLCSEWSPYFDNSISYFGMDSHTYCEFMGLYLSEGSVYVKENSYRISIYQNKQNPIMQNMLDKTGMKWIYDTGNCWRATNNKLGKYLTSFGKAKQKFVPQEIKEMPKELIQAFIYAYTMGDGHIRVRKNGSVEHTLFTTSKRMADDMQELAQKAGWNSSLRKVKPQISVIIEDGIERVITNDGGYSICFKKSAKRAELLKRNFKRIPYKGKIYCLNVPYHTLYIRRNGKPSWNGNTPACVVVQLSPRGRLMVLKEYTGHSIGIRNFAESIVIPGLMRDFPYCKVGKSVGDPSGAKRDEIMEEMSCLGELNSLGIPTIGARTNKIDPRLGAIRYFLNKMIDGKPAFVIDKRKCPVLYKGFVKEYVYKRVAVAGEERYKDEPDKNMASHPMDALGYDCLELASDHIMQEKTQNKPVDVYNPVMRIFN